jgi:glycosyltransferase involved in cell wall biosynthesis
VTVRYVLYTAVLPRYRQSCMSLLNDHLSPDFQAYAGDRHLDPTVRTALNKRLYQRVRNVAFSQGRILLQLGHWRHAIAAETCIVDLNPRSLTAWMLLATRRVSGRRTLTWGHLYPQEGAGARTGVLRRTMRRISSGTVLYGYGQVAPAQSEAPNKPVWVAPNALYDADFIQPRHAADPRDILYIGRLEPSKKVHVLLEGFDQSGLAAQGCRLVVIGEGSERARLEGLANQLQLGDALIIRPGTYEVNDLADAYGSSFVSVSPGYVGLSLTQSLGFGVPMIISRDEPHSPELELERLGGTSFFATDDADDLGARLREAHARREDWPSFGDTISQSVRALYSAEAMAAGLERAFADIPQDLGEDGWPTTKP